MAVIETNYREVQRRLKETAPAIRNALNRDLRGYARVIATAAKANASWSAQIPKAIGVTVNASGAGIKVKGPLGPLYERGGTGKGRAATGWESGGVSASSWRHPLFGDREHWYDQKTRPFVKPAIEATKPEAFKSMERAIQAAARAAGF